MHIRKIQQLRKKDPETPNDTKPPVQNQVSNLPEESKPVLQTRYALPDLNKPGLKGVAKPRAFTTTQLGTYYNFPTGTGAGQKIGVIELGGGYRPTDIQGYFTNVLRTTSTPRVTAVSVNGATNNPSDTSGANIEVVLDIEIIAGIAPMADIFVYFAPNSFSGFYNAIAAAVNGGCKIISISWGAAERYWPSGELSRYNSLFQAATISGVTIFAAAGDNGSSDGAPGNNADFPASSPFVIACGGTTVTPSSEVVWNNNPTTSATGGGYSGTFARPLYQNGATTNTKRGLPDICANADPNTGYTIWYRGATMTVGGTSAVSPLWSGLLALINQRRGSGTSFGSGAIHTILYQNPGVLKDITVGNNGSFSASTGWDPTTGLGSPNGVLISNLLSGGSAPAPTPTPPPVPAPTPDPQPSSNPTPTFTASIIPLTMRFTSTTPGAVRWLWTFGDGGSSTQRSPTNIYRRAGTFTVTLKVWFADGSSKTLTQEGYVTVQ